MEMNCTLFDELTSSYKADRQRWVTDTSRISNMVCELHQTLFDVIVFVSDGVISVIVPDIHVHSINNY